MNTKNRLIKAFREGRWADLFKGEGNWQGIRITKWYSSNFTARYWAKHYVAHIGGLNYKPFIYERVKLSSGTYDLSMIYLTQFEYKNNEIKKLKKLIYRLIQSYLHSNLLDSFIGETNDSINENMKLVHQFVRENILFAYILGLVDFTDTELEEVKSKILDKNIEIKIDIYDNAFYIFPYFTLLFQNSFENKKIRISKENIKELRTFFTNQNTIVIIKNFISFCKENGFGVYQQKEGYENVEEANEENGELLDYIKSNHINPFNMKVDENIFNSLISNLKRIKDSYYKTKKIQEFYDQNLTQFPKKLSPNLEKLSIRNNKIKIIENIEYLTKLQVINIGENPLEKITRSAYNFLKERNVEVLTVEEPGGYYGRVIPGNELIESLEIIENEYKK